MIKLEKTEVYGWEAAIRGMRNPLNSWEKSDSRQDYYDFGHGRAAEYIIGENDHALMMKLAKAGSVHAKYRRMIMVSVDITAPLYWWKEFDTYKVGTVANSCSTMHKIHAKEFTLDDFSHEHLYQCLFNIQNCRLIEFFIKNKSDHIQFFPCFIAKMLLKSITSTCRFTDIQFRITSIIIIN